MRNLLLLLVLGVFLVGCAKQKDEYAAFRHQTSSSIFNQAETALVKRHYSAAVRAYEALDAIYPFGPYARRAQLHIIYAYYKDGDQPSAVAAADRYIRLYPRSQHIAYAYYMRGVISQTQSYSWLQLKFGSDPAWRDLTNQKLAFMSFNEVVTMYPDSPYANDALLRMHYLRNVIAEHSLELAQYYFSQKAYVAAANRASYVVKHFNGTLVVPEALALMVKSYAKLGLAKLERSSYLILQASYPNSKAFKSVA